MKKLQKQLDELLAEWQPRLRVADWEVNLLACRQRDMPDPSGGNAAACRTTLPRRIATIKILDPSDALYDAPETLTAELEDSVIHELIHLHFAPFMDPDPKSPIHIAQEQAIDALARCFVDTKRYYQTHPVTKGQAAEVSSPRDAGTTPEKTVHYGQTRLIEDSRRTEHLVLAGVRYGKSRMGPVWHHYRVKKNAAKGAKKSIIVAPTYKLAEEICLEYYRDYLLSCNLVEGRKDDFFINQSKLVIHFPKLDHKILTFSGDDPDRIVGVTSSHAWVDESALCEEQVRKNVLKRNSFNCDYQQTLHTTTPIGSEHWLFELFGPHKVLRVEGTPHSMSKSRLVLHGRTMDNPHLSRKYLRMLEEEFAWDSAYYANYVLGEWVSLSKSRFYFKFDEGKHVGDFAPRFTTPTLYLTFDNNTGHLAWAALQPTGKGVAVVKANESDADNVQVACEQILRAFPPTTWRNHYVVVYGDAVLWHWSNLWRETGFGLIKKLLQPHYPRIEVRGSSRDNPLIHDRSLVTNRFFAEDRLMIDRGCKKVILSARTTQTTMDGKVKKDSKDVITHPMEAVDRVLFALDPPLIRAAA